MGATDVGLNIHVDSDDTTYHLLKLKYDKYRAEFSNHQMQHVVEGVIDLRRRNMERGVSCNMAASLDCSPARSRSFKLSKRK